MRNRNRREFVQFSAGALAAGLCPTLANVSTGARSPRISSEFNALQKAQSLSANENKVPLRLGLIIHIGKEFRYETGQETPITLVRTIQDVGTDNQGVNFDLANLILYGKSNPVDAIELLGPYVQGIHAKDGLWPTNPRELGKEVPIGKGKVDFPRIIARLKQLNYQGAVTIEREVFGPEQIEDVRAAKVYLERIIG